MVIRISQAILIASGALTGLGLVYTIHRLTQTNTSSDNSTSTPRSNRPRRARHIRRRRNRTDASEPSTSTNENAMDIDDDARGSSVYKEWSEDDNKNLINLLSAISENQSRKGMLQVIQTVNLSC